MLVEETVETVEGIIKYETATSLFAERTTDLFGPKQIKMVFGIDVPRVPTIKFSEEEMGQALLLDQALVLFLDRDKHGQPMTVNYLASYLNKLGEGISGEFDHEDERKDAVFSRQTPALEWKFVSRRTLRRSKGLNYLYQSFSIADYLRNLVYSGDTMPKQYEDAVQELDSKSGELINKLVDGRNAVEVSQRLLDLKINKLFRLSPVEVMYFNILDSVLNKTNPDGFCCWTNVQQPNSSRIIYVREREEGIGISAEYPYHSNPNLGIRFARSATPI